MFAIMFVSSIATLFILPAIITLVPRVVFEEQKESMVCNCRYCFIIALAVSIAIVYVLRGYTTLGWPVTVFIAITVIAIMGGICANIAKNRFCFTDSKGGKK